MPNSISSPPFGAFRYAKLMELCCVPYKPDSLANALLGCKILYAGHRVGFAQGVNDFEVGLTGPYSISVVSSWSGNACCHIDPDRLERFSPSTLCDSTCSFGGIERALLCGSSELFGKELSAQLLQQRFALHILSVHYSG